MGWYNITPVECLADKFWGVDLVVLAVLGVCGHAGLGWVWLLAVCRVFRVILIFWGVL